LVVFEQSTSKNLPELPHLDNHINMWGNTSTFGGGGGGFMTSFSSPGGGAKADAKGPRKAVNLFPATIRQLLDCPDDVLKIEDTEAHTVTIVGIVRRVETSTTRVSFLLDDQTGTIEAINYVGTDEVGGVEPQTELLEGTYGRIVGSLRSQRGTGEKYLIIYKVFPVTDMNEVTCHGLEVIQVPLKLKKLKELEARKTGVGLGAGMDNTFSTSMVGGGFGGSVGGGGGFGSVQTGGATAGITNNQNRVLNFMKKNQNEDGIHRAEVAKFMGMAPAEAMEVIESLSNEGLIYSTKDDDHFRVTDG